jgi:uncharacterized protein DUF2779
MAARGDMEETAHRYQLSKSTIAMFEQCPKRLWLSVHRPDLIEEHESYEERLATGHAVGAIARGLLPNGTIVEANPLSAALATTRALLDSGHDRPIFEATLEYDGVLVQIDILEPNGDGSWRLAEVKSSTSVKAYHYGDLATQLWVANNTGVTFASVAIRHINNAFTLQRDGYYYGLLSDTELLPEVITIANDRSRLISEARETLKGTEPTILPSDHCHAPFTCEFSNHCQAAQPPGPEWPVSILPFGGGKRWIEQNIHDLLQVKRDALTNEIHRRVYDATLTGLPYHDVAGARAAMADWKYPRTWLDFETIAFAVPRWIGTRPYQQVPFQFSAHIECSDGPIDHRDFLRLDGTDPRRSCAEALVGAVPTAGAIIGYNASFEKARIEELANAFPDLADRLRSIADRIVDLLPVARKNWYHRDQRGSWSIKAVLPTLDPELDYSTLEVKDGGSAQQAYLEAILGSTTDDQRREIDIALRTYCELDTHAMIVISRRLANSADTQRLCAPSVPLPAADGSPTDF